MTNKVKQIHLNALLQDLKHYNNLMLFHIDSIDVQVKDSKRLEKKLMLYLNRKRLK